MRKEEKNTIIGQIAATIKGLCSLSTWLISLL
jgi:hypothetical protein